MKRNPNYSFLSRTDNVGVSLPKQPDKLVPQKSGTGWIVGGEIDSQGVTILRTQQALKAKQILFWEADYIDNWGNKEEMNQVMGSYAKP